MTLNTQSIDGAAGVAERVLADRAARNDRTVRTIPVLMRVEDAEQAKVNLRREYGRRFASRRRDRYPNAYVIRLRSSP